MKVRILSLMLVFVLFLVSGCATAKYSENNSISDTDYGYSDTEVPKETTDEINLDDVIRKVIKNGSLSLETIEVDKTYANIISYVEEKGGYEFSHEKSDKNGYSSIQAVIKINPENLDDIMLYSGTVADIISSSTTSEDITEQYYDAQIRLDTKRKMLESYYVLLEKATTTSEILSIQGEINNLTEEIEAFEGKLRLWDQRVSESTLTLNIYQIDDPNKPKEDIDWSSLGFSDMGRIIKNGFVTVINVIWAILQWAAIIIAILSPIIIIGLICLIIIKKKKKNKKV